MQLRKKMDHHIFVDEIHEIPAFLHKKSPIPSGKYTQTMENKHLFMGKPTISMAMASIANC